MMANVWPLFWQHYLAKYDLLFYFLLFSFCLLLGHVIHCTLGTLNYIYFYYMYLYQVLLLFTWHREGTNGHLVHVANLFTLFLKRDL